ncbi:GHKL domain-containing protein [Panacibacter sp. KCS-6]|uniref:histidine kinase n=2 Tax=Limnovirga soli TaxID=2656915 RepID=A0A8J8JUR0_9BACT|nr:GHKL domain-containing protein [Limnovirga soli]
MVMRIRHIKKGHTGYYHSFGNCPYKKIHIIIETFKMNNLLKFFITFVFFSFHITDIQAKDKVLIPDAHSGSAPIGKYIYLFNDTLQTYSNADIVFVDKFVNDNKDITIFQNIMPGIIWAKFSISNQHNIPDLNLNLPYSNISEISLFIKKGDSLELLGSSGNRFDFKRRVVTNPAFVFPLNLSGTDTSVYYIKIKSSHPILLPLFISDKAELNETVNFENLFFGLYFGIILSLLLYNFFLYISTKDESYFLYIIYLFFLGFAQTTVSGYGFKYFWPNIPVINEYALPLTTSLAGITGILFTIYFLRVSFYFKRLVYVLAAVILFYFIAILASVFGNNELSYTILNYAGIIAGLLLIIISFMIGRKGYKPAYFYFVAWVFFLAGIIVFSLRNLNIIPYTSFSTYVLYIGSSVEAILLSTALADKINLLRKEKDESQVYALSVARENEQLIKEQNIVLEQKVAKRTDELQNTNNQLSQTLLDLQDAQTQLVQAEKMASLGQLTAGIAHEINNPINFVKSNIKPLQLDINDLFEIIDEYNSLHKKDKESVNKTLKDIYSKQENIGLDFIKNEIQQLIKGIENGADRTAEIVRGLRTFSRLDESELKSASVHDGLDSTFVLLRNSMPVWLKIEKHFNANGVIECYPGKLNQVFMNILNNAMQAIVSKQDKTENECITVETRDIENNYIQISIKDTGTGMTEEVKAKIFEPFFTTKAVGEGTGLGMAIVFKIIQSHHGKIEIESEPGKGTEFIITLPHIQKEDISTQK